MVYVADLDQPVCEEQDAHHLADVLRLRRGEEVAVSDGQGTWRLCALEAVDAGRGERGRRSARVILRPAGAKGVDPGPVGERIVGFALQKGDRPEWTVQKLAELGATRILPLLTERTVVRLDDEGRRRRGDRLRRVAREASAQSRRTRLPRVEDPAPLEEVLVELSGRHQVAFAEPGGGTLGGCDALLVGPEGGWSPDELRAAGKLVDLGPLVLRAETAALLAAMLLGAEGFATASTRANE